MQIQTHILTDLPVFDIGESLEKAVLFFEGSIFSHVAISENGSFLGTLGENDLDTYNTDKKIEDYRYNLEAFFVRKDSNWLDVLETFARNEANLLAVLDDNEEVIGYYDLTEIVGAFIDTPFFTEPGDIVVVAKGTKDYSFSEIAQIIESNNAKIIGAFITDMRNDVVQITLKISTSSLNEVFQTFRRYNYNILFGSKDDQFLEDLKQRSDYLDKYLNV
ncbi:CBS domain-containing protein [Ulvibacterium sp.]|uniref:CBS domain-containing protein n=1 Tax=Ulvibacterium sp. TaxID=2665914 RepID=UPI003CC65E1F